MPKTWSKALPGARRHADVAAPENEEPSRAGEPDTGSAHYPKAHHVNKEEATWIAGYS